MLSVSHVLVLRKSKEDVKQSCKIDVKHYPKFEEVSLRRDDILPNDKVYIGGGDEEYVCEASDGLNYQGWVSVENKY